jgi:hypothetical protein
MEHDNREDITIMGNRAVIAFQEETLTMIASDTVGIYLHWNGGPDSVHAFLDAAKELGVRPDDYGVARLCQIIGNWFGGTLSIGIGLCRTMDTDNGDNGTYVVDLKNHGWKIAKGFHRDGVPPRWGTGAAILAEVLEVNRPIFQPGSDDE